MTISTSIGIIGIGNMGTALISGLLKAGRIGKNNIYAADISAQRRNHVSKTYGIRCFSSNKTVVAYSDILIIAVEPTHVRAVLEDIKDELAHHLLVSIAAGITIKFLRQNLQRAIPIVRAMPNSPCLIGEGMTVLAPTPEVPEETLKTVESIFSSVGEVLILEERFIDAVTGLSGSGPAFIYLIIEGLVEGGIKAGLPGDVALTLAAQTVSGAGKMILETNRNPTELLEMVATPGGTTVEGLKELERCDIKGSLSRAVERASERARELSNSKETN